MVESAEEAVGLVAREAVGDAEEEQAASARRPTTNRRERDMVMTQVEE